MGDTAGCFRVIGGDSIKGSWDGGIMAVIGKLDLYYGAVQPKVMPKFLLRAAPGRVF
jgi:hypothetical protein